jgi:hypothetical protein
MKRNEQPPLQFIFDDTAYSDADEHILDNTPIGLSRSRSTSRGASSDAAHASFVMSPDGAAASLPRSTRAFPSSPTIASSSLFSDPLRHPPTEQSRSRERSAEASSELAAAFRRAEANAGNASDVFHHSSRTHENAEAIARASSAAAAAPLYTPAGTRRIFTAPSEIINVPNCIVRAEGCTITAEGCEVDAKNCLVIAPRCHLTRNAVDCTVSAEATHCVIEAERCTVQADNCTVHGNYCTITGHRATIYGSYCANYGYEAIFHGSNNNNWGQNCVNHGMSNRRKNNGTWARVDSLHRRRQNDRAVVAAAAASSRSKRPRHAAVAAAAASSSSSATRPVTPPRAIVPLPPPPAFLAEALEQQFGRTLLPSLIHDEQPAESHQPRCSVCLERAIGTLALPCKHASMCVTCACGHVNAHESRAPRTLARCPYCNDAMEEVLSIRIIAAAFDDDDDDDNDADDEADDDNHETLSAAAAAVASSCGTASASSPSSTSPDAIPPFMFDND